MSIQDKPSVVTHSLNKINVLKQFHRRLLKERFINNQASVYYSSSNSKFVIPGILITGISSVISFMATSDLLNSSTKSGFSIGVGIFTAGATILQSISSSFGFQSRAEAFQKSADEYDTLITKIEFEISNPNEDFNEFCNGLETAILDIKANCKYLPPLFIYKIWDKHKSSQQSDLDKLIPGGDSNSIHTSNNSVNNKDCIIDIKDTKLILDHDTIPINDSNDHD
jgi:hypothetical protein